MMKNPYYRLGSIKASYCLEGWSSDAWNMWTCHICPPTKKAGDVSWWKISSVKKGVTNPSLLSPVERPHRDLGVTWLRHELQTGQGFKTTNRLVSMSLVVNFSDAELCPKKLATKTGLVEKKPASSDLCVKLHMPSNVLSIPSEQLYMHLRTCQTVLGPLSRSSLILYSPSCHGPWTRAKSKGWY